jgi:hypothetical protein
MLLVLEELWIVIDFLRVSIVTILFDSGQNKRWQSGNKAANTEYEKRQLFEVVVALRRITRINIKKISNKYLMVIRKQLWEAQWPNRVGPSPNTSSCRFSCSPPRGIRSCTNEWLHMWKRPKIGLLRLMTRLTRDSLY